MPKKRHIDDEPTFSTDFASGGLSEDAILLPNALLGRVKGGLNAQLGGKKRSPMAPEVPAPTPWGKSNPDSEHVKKAYALSSMRDEDPREALLKYAEIAQKEPMFTVCNTLPLLKPFFFHISLVLINWIATDCLEQDAAEDNLCGDI